MHIFLVYLESAIFLLNFISKFKSIYFEDKDLSSFFVKNFFCKDFFCIYFGPIFFAFILVQYFLLKIVVVHFRKYSDRN